MARFRQFTKRQLWQRFLVQKVPTFYMIVDQVIKSSKNWDGAESKTRPSNLPDINLNQSELTRDTYLIFCSNFYQLLPPNYKHVNNFISRHIGHFRK
jgi:hypothetical protein